MKTSLKNLSLPLDDLKDYFHMDSIHIFSTCRAEFERQFCQILPTGDQAIKRKYLQMAGDDAAHCKKALFVP